MLPGPSVFDLAGYVLWSIAIWAISAVFALVGVVASRDTYQYFDPFSLACLAVFVMSLTAACLLPYVSALKSRKEIAAGYTTAAQGHNEVERRHSRTGVVMRAAGESDLGRADWEAAMMRVRAFEEERARSQVQARPEKRPKRARTTSTSSRRR